MRRRDFLALVGVTSTHWWPLAAAAQLGKIARIGVLSTNGLANFGPFQEVLRARGYVEGQNAVFEIRDAAGNAEQLAGLADDLVRSKVDIIVAGNTDAVLAASKATHDIPIVMGAALEPIANGLIASLAHPGANVTGVAAAPGGAEAKMLDLFHEMKPSAQRMAVLTTPPPGPGPYPFVDLIAAAGTAAGIAVQPVYIRGIAELDQAFAAIAAGGSEALITSATFVGRDLVDLALRYKLASFAVGGVLARAGGLLGYNANIEERGQLIASYVYAILKGASPANLAVQQPTSFELTVNLKTAKAIGIEIPQSILLRATEVIS